MKWILYFAWGAFVACAVNVAFADAKICVSPKGSDSGDGSAGAPYATLEAAKKRAVELFSSGEKKVSIVLGGGTYFFRDSVWLKKGDIPAGASLSISAESGADVLFHGGVNLPASKFKRVSDKSVLAKLPPEKPEGALYFLDLKEHGLENCGEVVPRAFCKNGVSQMEAFLDSVPMRLARFPNGEFEFKEFGEVVKNTKKSAFFKYDYDRPARWTNAKKAFLHGRIRRGYCDSCIPLKSVDTANRLIETENTVILPGKSYYLKNPEKNVGYNPALDIRGYSAINLLEEADRHGEYYVDTDAGKFYAVIDDPSKYSSADFSLLETPFVVLDGVDNVSFSGVKFAYARGNAVVMSRVNNVKFEECEFFNLGLAGISMEESLEKDAEKLLRRCPQDSIRPQSTGSSRISVLRCSFRDLGDGGILMMGGDIPKIRRADNLVADCTFERVSRINRSYSPAVRVYGCGNTVEHCLIRDLPHEAIAHNGIECTIRRNRIENVCNFTDDMGAIYGGANPYERGVKIVENYFNNILPKVGQPEISAVFIDDGNGGVEIRSNLICRTGTRTRPALFIHGGRGNRMELNVFLDCPTIARCDFWKDSVFIEKVGKYRERYLKRMGSDDSALLKKYPDLNKVFSDGNLMNYLCNSRVFRTGGVFKGIFYMNGNRELSPAEPVPADVEWTLENIKKYFSSDSHVARLANLHYGPRPKK